MFVVAMARLDQSPAATSTAAYDDACRRVDELVGKLSRSRRLCRRPTSPPAGDPQIAYESNFTQAEFEDAVRKCEEYIQAGDIFQVVLSQRLQAASSTASRSTSTARCGSSIPARSCSTCARRR